MLQLEQVTKTYAAAEGAPRLPILRNLSLALKPGESLAVIGPSGSGKSTLLNIMGTLDRPDSGQVRLDSQDCLALSAEELAQLRNRKVGFIFQAHHLLPHCTAWENVLVPALAQGPISPETSARAKRLLERVGLGDRLQHLPGQLSGGERQRVAVVRALINQPKLVLADEPTGALDRKSASELGQLLVELNREEKVTLVVATHALDLAKLMGRVMELKDGQLAEAK
jgi:ABC-type lipoprotein export system ATPase subunit